MFKDKIVISFVRKKIIKDISKMSHDKKAAYTTMRNKNLLKQFKLGMSRQTLAEMYDMSYQNVYNITNKKKINY
jgi:hypothetical protein